MRAASRSQCARWSPANDTPSCIVEHDGRRQRAAAQHPHGSGSSWRASTRTSRTSRFSDYEFTITFARIDHEVEEGDVPGVVVSRVNMSQQFMKELLDGDAGRLLEVHDRQGHPGPARDGRPQLRSSHFCRACHCCAIAMRCISVGWFSSQR